MTKIRFTYHDKPKGLGRIDRKTGKSVLRLDKSGRGFPKVKRRKRY